MVFRRLVRGRRSRVSRKRRPTLRRRNVGSRVAGAFRSRTAASTMTNFGGWNYKRKRKLPFRAYINKMFVASNAMEKHRSQLSANFAAAVSSLVQSQARVYYTPAVADVGAPFWTAAGGLQFEDGDSAASTFGGMKMFIRGGTSNINFTNTTTVVLRINVWRIRTGLAALSLPFAVGGIVQSGWDPSLPVPLGGTYSPGSFYKFSENVEMLLKPGESMDRQMKIFPQIIDQTRYNAFSARDFWMFSVQNLSTAVAVGPAIIVSHNLAFTADRTA